MRSKDLVIQLDRETQAGQDAFENELGMKSVTVKPNGSFTVCIGTRYESYHLDTDEGFANFVAIIQANEQAAFARKLRDILHVPSVLHVRKMVNDA